MRYRCISVLEEYICTHYYTPFGGPAWGLPVKMLNIFIPKARGSVLASGGLGGREAPLILPLSVLVSLSGTGSPAIFAGSPNG